ncbi:MAG TPA: hypothetical protein VFZ53_29640 [Polyangiaceae bacterium]
MVEVVAGTVVRWGSCAVGLLLTACPGAAELEDVDRFDIMKDPPVPTQCDQALPEALPSGCDYRGTLQKYCARGGCHGSFAAGGLDLRPDELLIARILNVPAKYRLSCGPGMACDPVAPLCAECDACSENALLVHRETPAESWILKKMEPFVPGTTANVFMNCGDAMPSLLTGNEVRQYSDGDKACLTEFFTHVATSTPHPERYPCAIVADGGT